MSGLSSRHVINKFQRGEINLSQTLELLNKEKKQNNNKKHRHQKNGLNKTREENKFRALDELNKLVGLQDIKKIIKKHLDFLQVQKLRRNYHLENEPPSMHMIFRGNPGTGKTTVARLIGKIFRETGFLSEGQFVEVERADLVGEYIGHTARKTREYIEKALGGVLFIDEAYSLARGGRKDFGKEAIDTLVRGVENNREELVVILAGYKQEMVTFINSNPGLESRFPLKLDFSDYNLNELVQIANLMFNEREYILTKNSKHYISKVIQTKRENRNSRSRNARMVRNIVEETIRNHAQRIIENRNNISRRKLMTIRKVDLLRGRTKKNHEQLPDSRQAQCR